MSSGNIMYGTVRKRRSRERVCCDVLIHELSNRAQVPRHTHSEPADYEPAGRAFLAVYSSPLARPCTHDLTERER